jgi:CRISPR-associated endonuclease Csn1
MSKYTLGLDIGTNSLGWILFENKTILDKGIIIFPIGTNVIKGVKEITKNEERRGYRGASRNHFRYKLRRKDLRKILSENEMLPEFSSDRTITALELYQLRTDALSKKISEKDLGRILLLLNKHRGFKSNSKTLNESSKEDEDGKVAEGINQLQHLIVNSNSQTVGEYFYKMYLKANELYKNNNWHNKDEPIDERAYDSENNEAILLHNNRGLRRENGRYVARSMYEKEFDLIWDKQKAYYSFMTGSFKEYELIKKLPITEKINAVKEFKKTLYWEVKNKIIYYQRPLKSQKKFIGKCTFETNKRTAPKSSLLFQEFRVRKQLADLRYSDFDNDILKQKLSNEWKELIFDYLQKHSSLKLAVGRKDKEGNIPIDIMDVLSITNKKNFEFINSENDEDKKLIGNKTTYALATCCGDELYNKLIEENNLEKIWHLIYMATDDEWLKDTLIAKWGFDEIVADKLVAMALEDGFASFSSKAIKKILPFIKNGNDEYDSLILANYVKAPDEVKTETVLASKIKLLKNNELRNPVVEKAVGETIRLVNQILNTYPIDQNDFEIHVESTREFKKPKEQREKMRQANSDVDKRRMEYAKFLNEKRDNGELDFKRDIQKNSPIIQKFELWLELGADKNQEKFLEFEKLVKRKDREKHTLWLECNRICPYTGEVINLSKCFSSETEIEHIIPYSKCLDDSIMNKTLTFAHINKQKGNKTAYEFMKSKGEEEFKKYKKRLDVFTKEKREDKFLLATIKNDAFANSQLTNTSYIAKYVRTKLWEICSNVQFTNGSATGELRKNDWQLNNLLDKIRFDEEFNTDIDTTLKLFNLYKKDFENWRKNKANSTDIPPIDWRNFLQETTQQFENETKQPLFSFWQEIQKYDEFRGAKGKKDRSDHRHHLLDAIVIALTSRSIIQQLSTLNAHREIAGYSLYDERGHITRDRIDLPIEYKEIKNALTDVLVYHKPEQKLITSKINRTKKKENGKTIILKQKTFVPRGSLVKDNFYGKLKKPRQQGFDKDAVFVKRENVNPINFKDEKALDKVVDKNVRELLRLRLLKYEGKGEKAFTEEALLKDPFYMYSLSEYPNGFKETPKSKEGKTLPVIKKVRVANRNVRNLVQIPAVEKDYETKGKTVVNENRYAETDGNYAMALYELKQTDTKGKPKKTLRDFELLSFNDAIKKRLANEQLFPDEKIQQDGKVLGLLEKCPFLKKDDLVIMYENNEDEIDWNNVNDLKRRLYKVNGMSSLVVSGYEYGILSLSKHNVSNQNAVYGKVGSHLKKYHSQLKAIKVKLNRLGKIEKHNKFNH